MKPVRLTAMATLALALAACSPGASASEPAESEGAPSQAAASAGESQAEESQAAPSQAGVMTSIFDVVVGDCFNSVEEGTVDEVEVVPCAQLHDRELYAAFDYPAGDSDEFPGQDVVQTYAEEECVTRFEPFVGQTYDDSELYIFHLTPSPDTWAEGDREILCTLYLQDGQLEGSMEGSER